MMIVIMKKRRVLIAPSVFFISLMLYNILSLSKHTLKGSFYVGRNFTFGIQSFLFIFYHSNIFGELFEALGRKFHFSCYSMSTEAFLVFICCTFGIICIVHVID